MWFVLFLVFLDYVAVAQKNVGDKCVEQYMQIVGRCEYVSNCQSAQREYQLSGLYPTYCENADDTHEPIVCCKDRSNILEIERTSPSSRLSTEASVEVSVEETKPRQTRISDMKCAEYSSLVSRKIGVAFAVDEQFSISAANCQFGAKELIIGGVDAALGEFPHMVAIGWENFEDEYEFFCGGTLISSQHVITAGHCVHYDSRSVKNPAPVVVRLGDMNLDSNVLDGATPVDVRIQTITPHPKYKSPLRYHDLAILSLVSKVEFNSNIRPACLWSQRTIGYSRAVATGWGVVDTRTTKRARNLQKVGLALLDNEVCDQKLDRNRLWSGMLESQLCAGDLAGGKDSCQGAIDTKKKNEPVFISRQLRSLSHKVKRGFTNQLNTEREMRFIEGDSGGPLQVSSRSNPCLYYIVGITSFGHKCAVTDRPAIYTRVSSYIDWIEKMVWPDG